MLRSSLFSLNKPVIAQVTRIVPQTLSSPANRQSHSTSKSSHLLNNITTTTITSTTNPTSKMSSDEAYNSFLTKANADPNSGSSPSTYKHSTSQGRSSYDPSLTKQTSPSIPASLQNLPDIPYTSDTDSDWAPVFLNYADDTSPSLEQFKQVLRATYGYGEGGNADVEVEELSVNEFDPRDRYKEIIERVRKVKGEVGEGVRGNLNNEGEVKVFRVQVTRTRVEYYLVVVGERKLVGLVAKAVES